MRITFLGGAEEIGASCAVLDLEGMRVVVDCGQRLGASLGQALPDFSLLENGPPITAVLVTHAHADHIGALPALEPYLPKGCPFYATEPTIALTKVMLQDSVRIMTRFRHGEGDLPLFIPANVAPALARFQPVKWGRATRLLPNREIFATWFPSGHILGSAMIEVRGKSGSVLFSGDVSVADQMSVPGVFAPAIQPNILVLESTYGNRLHAHRPTQERRLIDRVREIVTAGGNVLFPTFALGRAQEILLLLGKAMREGLLPRIPVYADGLVRAVSKVYNRLQEDLSPWCRRLWENGLDPIFPEDLPIRGVKDDRQRDQIIKGPPCVVVSSSGMLQGGASQFYARGWLRDPRHLVMITGYQDEESPGQALLNLATLPPGEVRRFKLSGVLTEVLCQVESCWLSAHADNGELTALASKLQPQLILPVHGDGEARAGLARSLTAATKARVVLPANGESYGLDSADWRPPARSGGRVSPLSVWPPWDPNQLRKLDLDRFHEWLTAGEERLSWITLDELAELWKSPQPISGAEWAELRSTVYLKPQPYFVPDAKRPYLLHLTPRENLSVLGRPEKMPVERAAQVVRELFPPESGLQRIGFFPEENAVRLEFQFPAAARERFSAKIGQVSERIGWTATLNEGTKEADLIGTARQFLDSEELKITVRHNPPMVQIALPQPVDDDEDLPDRFQRRTGYELKFTPVET